MLVYNIPNGLFLKKASRRSVEDMEIPEKPVEEIESGFSRALLEVM